MGSLTAQLTLHFSLIAMVVILSYCFSMLMILYQLEVPLNLCLSFLRGLILVIIFRRVEVTRTFIGLLPSQPEHAMDILAWIPMEDCKPIFTAKATQAVST